MQRFGIGMPVQAMKIAAAILWLFTTGLPAAESTNLAPTNTLALNPLSGPRGTLIGVTRGTDKRTLVIHYEFLGRTNEQTVSLTKDIADFQSCSWIFGFGVALALSDTDGDIYWAAAYFARLNRPLFPHKIRVAGGDYKLLGIANTRGDTIVVSAIDHHDEDAPRGWMYISGCPPAADVFFAPPIQTSGFDRVLEFEVPRKPVEEKK
jgi:hypothetical protein